VVLKIRWPKDHLSLLNKKYVPIKTRKEEGLKGLLQ
jgi:hypothetical protein